MLIDAERDLCASETIRSSKSKSSIIGTTLTEGMTSKKRERMTYRHLWQ
jgi:hypothetical protein